MPPAGLLIVAGHDSSGLAGVDADRASARAFEIPARFVVTAWTRQDSSTVHALRPVPPEQWAAELRHEQRLQPAALKVGLLPGVEHVQMMAGVADEFTCPIIVDPVIRASSGGLFLGPSSRQALLNELLPKGIFLTPNVPEAAELTGRDPEALAADPAECLRAARELLERGAAGIVLKGGHSNQDLVSDLVLARGEQAEVIQHARISGPELRGSGCRHATALAAGLAGGASLYRAASQAAAHIQKLLQEPD